MNISETIIGMSLGAIGTSLPDCLVSLHVARKGQGTMMVRSMAGETEKIKRIKNKLLINYGLSHTHLSLLAYCCDLSGLAQQQRRPTTTLNKRASLKVKVKNGYNCSQPPHAHAPGSLRWATSSVRISLISSSR